MQSTFYTHKESVHMQGHGHQRLYCKNCKKVLISVFVLFSEKDFKLIYMSTKCEPHLRFTDPAGNCLGYFKV